MPDLGDRLGRALHGLPDAEPHVRERVVRRAVALAPPRRPVHRRPAVSAAVAAAVVGTGAALAATGAVHVSVGPAAPAAPADGPRASATRPLVLPPGADGIAVLLAGRVHLRTAGGVGIDGLRATAVEISPNALYVAVGQHRGLTVLSTSGRRAWTRATTGPVVAAAWSPYPVWIAYVVALPGGRRQLRVIEGDGDHGRPVATGVARARPHWSDDGTRLHFAVAGGWRTFTPATGRITPGGSVCGDECGAVAPPEVARLRRDGAVQVGVARAAGGAVWALRVAGAVEVWWSAHDTRVARPRMVMRTAAPAGVVQVSLR